MYTVLIQTNKATDSFQRFSPLFADSIDKGVVDVCSWVESGRDIDSTLPGIRDLVAFKREWRAFVVCPEPDGEDDAHLTRPMNPFDFLENETGPAVSFEAGRFLDCQSPLIRLTHLLGGVPRQSVRYASRDVCQGESSSSPIKVEYEPLDSASVRMKNEILTSWEKDRLVDFFPPTEIVLIKSRSCLSGASDFEKAAQAWHVETDSGLSDFAGRNLYPGNCRFVTFDFDGRGLARREESLFNFWLAVLLLSTNKIKSDFLKAFFLYRVEVSSDVNALGESLQLLVNKLNYAKTALSSSIAEDEREFVEARSAIPDIDVDIPVAFEFSPESDLIFDGRQIGLLGGVDSGDLELWRSFCAGMIAETKSMNRQIDRTLDFAAIRIRERAGYPVSEVVQLNDYQAEDLRISLDEKYEAVLADRAALPASFSDIRPILEKESKKIESLILTRPSFRSVFPVLGLFAGMVLIGCLPVLGGFVSVVTGIAYVGAVFFAGMSVTVGVLWKKRRQFLGATGEFHDAVLGYISELARGAEKYSRFFSHITSHMRGESYLQTMGKTRKAKEDNTCAKKKHLAYVESLLDTLLEWAEVLHAKVDANLLESVEDFPVSSRAVDYEGLYLFSSGRGFKVPLNDSGVYIDSPHEFVRQLRLEKEGACGDV